MGIQLITLASATLVAASCINVSAANASSYPHFSVLSEGWDSFKSPLFSMRLEHRYLDTDVREVGYIRRAFPSGALNTAGQIEIQMLGNGSKSYICPEDHVVTELNRDSNGGDTYVSSFRCTQLVNPLDVSSVAVDYNYTLHSGSTSNSHALVIGEMISCGENEFIVGFDFADIMRTDPIQLNRHITKVHCRFFEYLR